MFHLKLEFNLILFYSMSIIYVLISKSADKILCEYTDFIGNFEQISRSLLKEIHPEHKATFSYDDLYYFHYLNSKNIYT